MAQQMKDLTISLLSSGRIDTVERCLSSLVPFKEELDTEIIVVDTDPDKHEDVRAILERYADIIIDFDWCDDFAAARNVGLYEARGRWFLFVDDDEYFIDAKPVIDFLKSEEQKKYNGALLCVRSFIDDKFEKYDQDWLPRLARLHQDTRFEGRVHEGLEPWRGPQIFLDAIVGHTGYVFANEDELYRHFERNVKLLKTILDDDPREMGKWMQLVIEYRTVRQYGESIEACKIALKHLLDQDRDKIPVYRGFFYAAWMLGEYNQPLRRQAVIDVYEEMCDAQTGIISRAYADMLACLSYMDVGNVEGAIKASQHFTKLDKEVSSQGDRYRGQEVFFLTRVFSNEHRSKIYSVLIDGEIQQGSWEAFELYFDKLDWGDECKNINLALIPHALDYMVRHPFSDRLQRMLKQFVQVEISKDIVKQVYQKERHKGLEAMKYLDQTFGDYRPLLSISLLSSGRIETIEKCLSSIYPLVDKIGAEIIVVDTDHNHDKEVYHILEKYASKIVPFEWCNDFAKARNAGLKESSGEWFMFLDDDEWFLDVEEIIDFFRSGEYKNYKCASYRIRDYGDFERREYRDEWILRMIKLEEDTHFHGKVHEHLDPVFKPQKLLRSTVEHFGYVFKSKEEHFAHAERNISLLREVIKEEPENVRWWMQLMLEYKAIGYRKEMLNACKKGIELLKDKDDDNSVRERGLLVAETIVPTYNDNNWNAVIEQFEDREKDGKIGLGADAYCCILASVAYMETERYSDACRCCAEYERVYQQFIENEDAFANDLIMSLAETFYDKYRHTVLGVWICSAIKLGNWAIFDAHFDSLKWETGAPYLFHSFVDKVLDYLLENPYEEREAHLMDRVLRTSWGEATISNKLSEGETKGNESFWHLVRAIASSPSEKWIAIECRILWADHIDDERFDYKKYYRILLTSMADIFSLLPLFWEVGKNHNVAIGNLLEKVSLDVLQFAIDRYVGSDRKQTPSGIIEKVIASFLGMDNEDSASIEYIIVRLKEAYIITWESEQDGKLPTDNAALTELFQWFGKEIYEFCSECVRFFERYYKLNAFTDDVVFLPEIARFSYVFLQLHPLDADHPKEVLEGLKNLLKRFVCWDSVIVYYSHLFMEYSKLKVLLSPKDEMQGLLDSLQNKVTELIDAGLTDEAEAVIEQIENFTSRM